MGKTNKRLRPNVRTHCMGNVFSRDRHSSLVCRIAWHRGVHWALWQLGWPITLRIVSMGIGQNCIIQRQCGLTTAACWQDVQMAQNCWPLRGHAGQARIASRRHCLSSLDVGLCMRLLRAKVCWVAFEAKRGLCRRSGLCCQGASKYVEFHHVSHSSHY